MTLREPLRRTPQEQAEEHAFLRRYGPWAPLDPAGVAAFMAGFERPWWVVGGWAIEAFTGARREHEDVDVSILARDVPALREHVGSAGTCGATPAARCARSTTTSPRCSTARDRSGCASTRRHRG
jgi:hypothetical protein